MREPSDERIAERVARRLHDHGSRFTAARRAVVTALATVPGPVTVADLNDRVGAAVPLSSLYRTLSALDDAGVLQRTHDPRGAAVYELAEWLAGHHHHVVCVECGEVQDLHLDPGTERALHDLVDGLAPGFSVTGHRVDIEGVCPACQS